MRALRPLPENKDPLNVLSLQWLKEAKEPPDSGLHLLTLAQWGLEHNAPADCPPTFRPSLELQVGHLCGWPAEDVLQWLLSNPNSEDNPTEERRFLVLKLRQADNPKQAASALLNAIWSKQQSQNSSLRPAASELT